MRKSKENPKPDYRVKIVRFILLAILLALGYNLTVSQYGFLNMIDLKKQTDALRAEEMNYNTQLIDLEIKRDRLQNDSLYIEKVARKQFQLGKPGEKTIEF